MAVKQFLASLLRRETITGLLSKTDRSPRLYSTLDVTLAACYLCKAILAISQQVSHIVSYLHNDCCKMKLPLSMTSLSKNAPRYTVPMFAYSYASLLYFLSSSMVLHLALVFVVLD